MLSRTITLTTHLSELSSPLGMTAVIMIFCFSVFTVVFGVFVKHHDSPIVKTNNWNLSYILLISLMFCFLCCLLFIGHPNSETCTLQQITFGVVLTMAVYTVLAKTITVLVTFTVTAPERKMRYLLISDTQLHIHHLYPHPNYSVCILLENFFFLYWHWCILWAWLYHHFMCQGLSYCILLCLGISWFPYPEELHCGLLGLESLSHI